MLYIFFAYFGRLNPIENQNNKEMSDPMLVLSDEKYHLNNLGFSYTCYEIDKNCGHHKHLYYEYMFIVSGTCINEVNGTMQYLKPNMLAFIRPHDCHSIGTVNKKAFKYFNVGISEQEMKTCMEFLGNEALSLSLNTQPLSPILYFSKTEAAEFVRNLETVSKYSVYNPDFKALSKMLLMQIIYKFHSAESLDKKTFLPQWMDQILFEMQQKENFTEGLSSMLRISGKTHEYLCRVFRKYLGRSPTHFINEIRLNHARYLLKSSSLPIIDIMLDSGFNNISHFNHLFKAHSNCSPKEFRARERDDFIDLNPDT